jgi:hypothetical protein
MLDKVKERSDLAKAERDIAEGAERVARQAKLVEELRRDGHGVSEAERLLKSMRATLALWRAHRRQIVSALRQKD